MKQFAFFFSMVAVFGSACGDKSQDTSSEENTEEPSSENTTEENATPEELGKELYDAKCASCHGADAQGGSGPNITHESDSHIYRAVQNGDGAMPAFPELSDDDIDNIIAYIRSL